MVEFVAGVRVEFDGEVVEGVGDTRVVFIGRVDDVAAVLVGVFGVVEVFVGVEGMGVTLVVGRVVLDEVVVIGVTFVTGVVVFVEVADVGVVFWVILLELMGIGAGATGCASGVAVVLLLDVDVVVVLARGGGGATTGLTVIGCTPLVVGVEVVLDVVGVEVVVAGLALLTVNLILLVILTGVFAGAA